ncbi:hypothetical protein T484DRAFT_1667548, partial [Baffinella frigidus]
MGYPSVVGRPSFLGLRMRHVLDQRGPLPSGAPGTDATRPQIVRWLLNNLHHEEAVLQLEQQLLPLWEQKGIGGTTAAKTGEALHRALDALSAPPQESSPGGGGEHLIEDAPTSCSQTTLITAHGVEKAAPNSMDATIGSSLDPLQHGKSLGKVSLSRRGLLTGGGPSQDPAMEREARPRPRSAAPIVASRPAAPIVPPRSAAPLAPQPSAPANIQHPTVKKTAKPLSLMSRAELGALCRGRGLPLGDPEFMLKVLSMPAPEAEEVRATWARQLAALQEKNKQKRGWPQNKTKGQMEDRIPEKTAPPNGSNVPPLQPQTQEDEDEDDSEHEEGSEHDAEGMTAYERERLENIKRNNQFLVNLGIDQLPDKAAPKPKSR